MDAQRAEQRESPVRRNVSYRARVVQRCVPRTGAGGVGCPHLACCKTLASTPRCQRQRQKHELRRPSRSADGRGASDSTENSTPSLRRLDERSHSSQCSCAKVLCSCNSSIWSKSWPQKRPCAGPSRPSVLRCQLLKSRARAPASPSASLRGTIGKAPRRSAPSAACPASSTRRPSSRPPSRPTSASSCPASRPGASALRARAARGARPGAGRRARA